MQLGRGDYCLASGQQMGPIAIPDWTLGCLFVFITALLWSGSSVLVQYIYLEFDSPFFITYLANTLFGVYLPGWMAAAALGKVSNLPFRRQNERYTDLCRQRKAAVGSSKYAPVSLDSGAGTPAVQAEASVKFSHLATMRISAVMCPCWFLANVAYNTSLLLTSVTSSTIM